MKRLIQIIIFSFLALNVLAQENELNIHPDLLIQLDAKKAPFYHGLASGDPTQSSCIIWTRITLDTKIKTASVGWEIAKDSLFKNVIQKGTQMTSEAHDFTVKVDVQNLKPNVVYYYRFSYNKLQSIVGKTKTLPKDKSDFEIAFASCSNYEWGYFNNYRSIANNKEIDLVVHLGDYIYEYGIGNYGDTTIGRINVPAHEIVTLNDYRTRYSLYRLDQDLLKVHQEKPFITTWDDHESANNSYTEGAENHQENEGNWMTRKEAAKKAYYEWLPVRESTEDRLYRSFLIGKLANLIILDTRLEGRTEQVTMESENYEDSTRTILGKEQYKWLINNLKKNQVWNIIGNQVPFGSLNMTGPNGKEKYMDGWEGYPYERSQLVKFLQNQKIDNTVFVTGDFHKAFALEIDLDGTKDSSDNVGIEFIVTSITSANDDEYHTVKETQQMQQMYLENNPNMLYCNNKDNGYVVVKIKNDKITTDFIYTSTVKQPKSTEHIEATFEVLSGKPVLIKR